MYVPCGVALSILSTTIALQKMFAYLTAVHERRWKRSVGFQINLSGDGNDRPSRGLGGRREEYLRKDDGLKCQDIKIQRCFDVVIVAINRNIFSLRVCLAPFLSLCIFTRRNLLALPIYLTVKVVIS